LTLFLFPKRSFEAKDDLCVERSIGLACRTLQLRPQVNREAERKTHSGNTASGFHIITIS
jgi:hypothetical protein